MGNLPADDYYALLGIHERVNGVELRRVWRRLARRWHPDHAGPEATAAFQKLSAAYEVLSDPAARAAYDFRRGIAKRTTVDAKPAEASATRRRAPAVMLSRVTGSLNALLACGTARRVSSDVIELFLNAREAEQGGMITISMRVPVHCRKCNGSAASCPECGGRGTVEQVFAAWLAVPPGVTDGTMLAPSELLPGMVHALRFQIRILVQRPKAG
jgi:molecular chaperone DnaJ